MTKNFVLFASPALHESLKSLIEHLSVSEQRPYTIAKQRLQKEYGSPWVISDAETERVSCNQDQWLQTAEAFFWTSWQNLCDCERHSSVHQSWFPRHSTELMDKPPFDIKWRWITKSVQIQNSYGHLAHFSHFVEFVRSQSEEMNSLFSLRTYQTKAKPTPVKSKASSFATSSAKPAPNSNSLITASNL